MSHLIHLTSFGYLHLEHQNAPLPQAERIEDVRNRFRDLAAAKKNGVLDLNGTDSRVQQVVLNTPGVSDFIEELVTYAERHLPVDQPRRIAIGCAGGKHRAASIVELTAEALRSRGHNVAVTHLHAHLPRFIKK